MKTNKCAALPMLPPPPCACHAHAAALGGAPHPAPPTAQSFVHAAAALDWMRSSGGCAGAARLPKCQFVQEHVTPPVHACFIESRRAQARKALTGARARRLRRHYNAKVMPNPKLNCKLNYFNLINGEIRNPKLNCTHESRHTCDK